MIEVFNAVAAIRQIWVEKCDRKIFSGLRSSDRLLKTLDAEMRSPIKRVKYEKRGTNPYDRNYFFS